MFSCCFKRDKQENKHTQAEADLVQQGPSIGNILDNYEKKQIIGEGAFATVWIVTHKVLGMERAMKVIRKDKLLQEDQESLLAEVALLKSIDHPNILRLHEFYEDAHHFYIITELLKGGELFDRIQSMNDYSEQFAAEVMKQVLSAVSYCHDLKIIHRDIKPENILLQKAQGDSELKIIDFGTSCKNLKNEKLSRRVGTPYYIAPEVLSKSYNEKCDVWSSGVVLFILLCGYPPFNGEDESEILESIHKGKVEFDPEEWDQISDGAKELIRKMLEVDPDKRISARQAFDDPWIQSHVKLPNIPLKALDKLQKFTAKSKLQAAISKFVVLQVLGNESTQELSRLFKQLDKNIDGMLSKEEFYSVYEQVYPNSTKQQINEIFDSVDVNHSGVIDYTEFIVAAADMQKLVNREAILKAFKLFDINGDGFISREELQQIFGGAKIDDQDWKQTLDACDTNKDGQISQEELVDLLCQQYK